MLRFGDVPDTSAPTEVFVAQSRRATARGDERTAVARAVLDAVVAASLSRADACPRERAQRVLDALEAQPGQEDWSEHVEWAAAQVREVIAATPR